jgi:hypothetical protein
MHRRRFRVLAPLLAALGAAGPAAAASDALTGVCPDGSIFVVRDPSDIPCRNAKLVDPHDVPPLHPEFLPRPYGWERFNQQTDPNNPYNLVGSTPPAGAPPPAPGVAPAPATPSAPTGAEPAPPPTPQVAAAPPPRPAVARDLELGLSAQDVRDLAQIIELRQGAAPARVMRQDGTPVTLQLACSAAFEQRVRSALARRGDAPAGPVVLFRADAEGPSAFHGNLTFVQGHEAFHPPQDDPARFGVLDGALGPLQAGQRVLGYAVLPAQVDLRRPVDIYWDDVEISATLSP